MYLFLSLYKHMDKSVSHDSTRFPKVLELVNSLVPIDKKCEDRYIKLILHLSQDYARLAKLLGA